MVRGVDWDADMEYRERCMDTLMNAVVEARSFLSLKDVLKIVLNAS